jgi:hypothetical protein
MSGVTDWGNWTITTLQITGSVVSGPHNAVLVGGDGTAGGETAQDVEAFGAPGIVFRPRAPEERDNADGHTYKLGAESLGARMGDNIVPFTWRDLRFNEVFPAPKPGTVALVGYGGAFLSFDDTTSVDSKGSNYNRATLYVPYANGTKCHTIVIDPDQDAIGIVHGSGLAIAMSESGGIVARADDTTTWMLKPGVCQIMADSIALKGNVTIGGDAAAGIPFSGGPAMLPCPSLFLSPAPV